MVKSFIDIILLMLTPKPHRKNYSQKAQRCCPAMLGLNNDIRLCFTVLVSQEMFMYYVIIVSTKNYPLLHFRQHLSLGLNSPFSSLNLLIRHLPLLQKTNHVISTVFVAQKSKTRELRKILRVVTYQTIYLSYNYFTQDYLRLMYH